MSITNVNNTLSPTGNDKKIIDSIIESKRILDPWEMVSETHKPEGAWAKIYREGSGNRNVIPTELIKAVG